MHQVILEYHTPIQQIIGLKTFPPPRATCPGTMFCTTLARDETSRHETLCFVSRPRDIQKQEGAILRGR